MSTIPVAPWRTGLRPRPDVPLPPAAMPRLRGRRPLKRWRWVGCFADEVMLCVAAARIGPLPVSWWAVWDRASRTLAEHMVHRGDAVRLVGSHVHVDDGPVRIELTVHEVPGVETVSPHGRGGYIWTRKQGGVRMTGSVTVADTLHALDAPGIVDDSAGYHARRTSWMWSAGVGTAESGAALAWNLVTGVHDSSTASERTVWVDGEPHEVGAVRFFDDLSRVAFAEGGALRFTPEAAREHRENLLLVASAYEQPFGTFTGTLPGAGALREGRGVMERHDVRW